MRSRHVYTGATLVTLAGETGYGTISDGALAVDDDRIAFVGPADALPDSFHDLPATPLDGRLVTPGLVDCHTHLVYGGSRAEEFELRLQGATYEEIARAGGGIFSTVKATREATEDELVDGAARRARRLLAEGVTTLEIKSGYGLDRETELRMLRAARRLGEELPVRVVTTFLGAHAVPKGMDADEYVDTVCLPTLAAAADEGLVDMVDGFCEGIGFTPEQIERVFVAARDRGLALKLHAEQLSNLNGAALAARFGAWSADHLEYLDDAGVAAMAEAGTVAVLLPGAFYYLHETQKPPIEALRAAGVPMAVATDSNPGSAPMTSLLLAMNMAATLFALTPEECLRGATTHANTALGIDDAGRLEAGARADFAIWDVTHPAELTYRIGDAPLHQRVFGGVAC